LFDRARVLEAKIDLPDEAKGAMLEELSRLSSGALGESCHHVLLPFVPC